ncbi:MAG: beta-eliminating lyase-related protein [Bacteroidota bacterium]|nr:beta-eliminating lyase-related protein [Bacteroidota bacterium]
MNLINRRSFLVNSGLLAGGLASGFRFPASKETDEELKSLQSTVKFIRDGIDMSPLEYSWELYQMAKENKIEIDYYSNGGSVEELEKKFASLLGKESAIFMPTGTLANHIAIRKLAGKRKRVIVQSDSHIYRDSGDCTQNLSGLNPIPVQAGKYSFTLADVLQVVEKNSANKVKTPIGAISIESPVRRHNNQAFPFEEMKKISDYARSRNIGMHLDGARLFNASAHSGILPHQYAELFDTVYISMYKDFNAPSGAILAGSREFTKDLYHTRRMFGGGMSQVWTFAVIALKYADSFLENYKLAIQNADQLFSLLNKNSNLQFEHIPNGTNVFNLYIKGTDPKKFRSALLKEQIVLPAPTENKFNMKLNVTVNRKTPEWIAQKFKEAL